MLPLRAPSLAESFPSTLIILHNFSSVELLICSLRWNYNQQQFHILKNVHKLFNTCSQYFSSFSFLDMTTPRAFLKLLLLLELLTHRTSPRSHATLLSHLLPLVWNVTRELLLLFCTATVEKSDCGNFLSSAKKQNSLLSVRMLSIRVISEFMRFPFFCWALWNSFDFSFFYSIWQMPFVVCEAYAKQECYRKDFVSFNILRQR